MRLTEALETLKQSETGNEELHLYLVCGFMPLHLETFIAAHLRSRFPTYRGHVHHGLFGDLEGNLHRAVKGPGSGAVVVIEFGDLDSRLSLRSSAGWSDVIAEDIATQVQEKCARLEKSLATLRAAMPVTLVGPTLAIPPLSYMPPTQSSYLDLRLQSILTAWLERVSSKVDVSVVSATVLSGSSPPHSRYDARMDLRAGFPYTLAHADAVACLTVASLFPPEPRKGLITDLDDTLWKGILGDVGVSAVSWNLEAHSQEHALYQQLLSSLADSGVLLAVASKNDSALVHEALQRSDVLVPRDRIFPVEASWGAKSAAITRILKAWNISPDSVVFVDDSRAELAEVSEVHPTIECLQFPTGDPAGVVALLAELRTRFGRREVRPEDQLRLESLRKSADFEEERNREAPGDFIRRLQAKMVFDLAKAPTDGRALELINKTNQFNLNGLRFSEADWKSFFDDPNAFLLTVSYEDRFGPLGRIAVAAGHFSSGRCDVAAWAMSCRAFSRHIEFRVIRWLYHYSRVKSIRFAFLPTSRNGPVREFFEGFFPTGFETDNGLTLDAEHFEKHCPPLFQEVNESGTGLVITGKLEK
jgi:FkbH-like protein